MTCPTASRFAAHLPPRLAQWAGHIHAAASVYGLDPYLLAAVCDRESLGGEALTPKGPRGVGDEGHGRGLMQIDDRWHKGFIRAEFDDRVPLWTDPFFVFGYAARLLRRLLNRFDQDVGAALCAYNAGEDDAIAVLKLMPPEATSAERIQRFSQRTTQKNYCSDVLRRRDGFTTKEPAP